LINNLLDNAVLHGRPPIIVTVDSVEGGGADSSHRSWRGYGSRTVSDRDTKIQPCSSSAIPARLWAGTLACRTPDERARRPLTGRLARDPSLRDVVQAKLELEWSPEQIAAWLPQIYPERRAWHVCHETIYQAVYYGGTLGLTRQPTAKLRTGRPLWRRRC